MLFLGVDGIEINQPFPVVLTGTYAFEQGTSIREREPAISCAERISGEQSILRFWKIEYATTV